jgi:hypothetical protein
MNFRQALDYLKRYPPKWASYIPGRFLSVDRIDEPGASSNPSERKNYALPYREIGYYDVVISGWEWLNRMTRRFTRRGLRVPSHQVWLHYLSPKYAVSLTDGTCATAGVNSGVGRPFTQANLFVLFDTAADLWARRFDWGGNLAFVQRDNPDAMAFECWRSTWSERRYYVRWLNRPDSFWDAILEKLCERSGIDAPCCTENLRGFYFDGWNEWHRAVTGSAPSGPEYYTPIADSSRYSHSQAVEAWRQLCAQARRILREHDAFKSERPSDYSPQICTNTYNAHGLQASTSSTAYQDPHVIPADGYITQTMYVNRNHWSWDWYTNPNRRTDSILLEHWWWEPHATQHVEGDIYRSVVTESLSLKARVVTALQHGLTVYLKVPFAVSRDDYEDKVIRIARFWSLYRTQFGDKIFFGEGKHDDAPRYPDGNRIDFVPYNGNPLDRRAGYPQPVSRLLRWNYDENPEFRPIKLTLNHGESE